MRCTLLLLLAAVLCAAERDPVAWPGYRGPDHRTATAAGGAWLKDLERATKAWSVEVGAGFSGVALAGGRAVTLGQAGGQTTVRCFDAATGAEQWKVSHPCVLHERFGSSSTPTVVKDRVYVFDKEGRFLCLKLADGAVVWQRDLKAEEGLLPPQWGFASSPVPVGRDLVVNAGFHGCALDAETGKTAWKSGPGPAGYATVAVREEVARTTLFVFNAKSLFAVDAANGKALWNLPWETKYDVNAATPLLVPGGVFISSGYGSGSALAAENGAAANYCWKQGDFGTQRNGAVVVDGRIYGVNAHNGKPGDLQCLDPETGAVLWSQGGFGQGALVAVGGRLVVLAEAGDLVVAEAAPKAFVQVARRKAVAGPCSTPPSVADGRVVVRSAKGEVVCWQIP